MVFSNDLDAIRNLHDCANDLFRSPITQQALVHHGHDKWINEVCEGSLGMLYVCGITRVVLLLVKGHLQGFQSALRRSSIGGQSSMGKRISAYHISTNKIAKKMLKGLETLKGMDGNYEVSPISEVDPDLMVVVTVVRELRATTIRVVESVVSFLSISKAKQRSKRSFFLNCMGGQRVANASEEDYETGLAQTMSTALNILIECNQSAKLRVYGVPSGRENLEALEIATEEFEAQLECMFRRLIQIRFSLLNTFNN